MSDDVAWAEQSINKAHQTHPAVTDAVAARLKDILTGPKSERILRGAELTSAAKSLLADMAAGSTYKAAQNDED